MKLIVPLNRRLGGAVIPIGRHTVMNSVIIKTGDIEDEARLQDYQQRVDRLFFRIGVVHDWRGFVVRRNLASMKRDDRAVVKFSTYLECAEQHLAQLGKRKPFRKLAAVLEVPDWYFAGGQIDLFSQN